MTNLAQKPPEIPKPIDYTKQNLSAKELLYLVLEQLKIMNVHLQIMTGEKVGKDELQ